ncbi:peptidylprolyl isomerase [Olleya namhaensis]|uniref:peptidylprolyl isomerase n=1 Tax=Olleya namhaensis TaxID=1144750 RepID=UPI002492B0EC|nr:peptidylprolyl isomerase [Olleya namhaensis]
MKMNVLRTTLIAFIVSCFFASAQEKTVLFTVNEVPVYTNEFKRVYNKNLDLVKDDSQKDIDNYLDLFVKYKLKIAEAKTLGLDKKPSYLREFGNYKDQLAKNYLNDNKVTDQLVEEAYNRLQTEVDANHILVKLEENASPRDSLLAFQEIQKLRIRAINEGFDVVKKDIHNGRTLFAEELGYFTAFKMVYSFENAAYNTPVGEWSAPFRTQFGYHVVLVKDKRKNRGDVTVAHIMLLDKEDSEDNQSRINEIYKRIKQGEDFGALAKQFSEDKSSSSTGGQLNTFSAGQLSSKTFEDQAFALEQAKDVSKPFKSEFGYHIVKLIEKQGIKSFSELAPELKNKIKRDSRSKVINDKRLEGLYNKYNVSKTTPDLRPIVSILNDTYFSSSWKIPANFKGETQLFKIGNTVFSQHDFAEFLLKSQRKRQAKVALEKLVADNYILFVESSLKIYQEENLENENEDYAQILMEYRDGLLLFDLMETEIWNAAKQDSIGLQQYFALHQDNYFYDVRVDAIVASSAKKSSIKKVAKMLSSNVSPDAIKAQLNSESKINVSFIEDILDANHQALPKDLKLETGVSDIFTHNDAYSVVSIKSVIPKTSKSFKEAKGHVIADFQEEKEKEWMSGLAKKYKVVINQEALNQVKEQLK